MNRKVGVCIILLAMCSSIAEASISTAIAKFFSRFGDEIPIHKLDGVLDEIPVQKLDGIIDDIPMSKVISVTDELPLNQRMWAVDNMSIYSFDDTTLMPKKSSITFKNVIDGKLHDKLERFIDIERKVNHKQLGISASSTYAIREAKYQRNFIIDYAVTWADDQYHVLNTLSQTSCGRATAKRLLGDALEDVKEKYAFYRKIIVRPKVNEIFHLSFRHLYIQALNERVIPAMGIKKVSLALKDQGYLFQDVKLSLYSLCGFKMSYSARTGKTTIDGGVLKGKKSI